ncbi:hypothetical protein ACYF6T_28480 [Streptomyces sp. 7R007]
MLGTLLGRRATCVAALCLPAALAPGFADIVLNNMPNGRLIHVGCEPALVTALMAATTAHATAEIGVDVAERTVTCEAAQAGAAPFRLDDARGRLVSWALGWSCPCAPPTGSQPTSVLTPLGWTFRPEAPAVPVPASVTEHSRRFHLVSHQRTQMS